MDEGADPLVVQRLDPVHRRGVERRERRGSRVGARLLRRLGTGDRRRETVEHEDPAQRELGEGRALGHERLQRLGDLDPGLVVDAGEGLADVELLAVAVEVAMVVRGEARGAAELPGQQPRGERDAGDDADVAALRLGEEALRGALAECVEDDLHGRDARELDRLERLLHALDGDAVARDQPARDEVVERLEDLRTVVDVRVEAVELNEVERVDLEVLAAALDPGLEVRGCVLREVERSATAHLRRDDERVVWRAAPRCTSGPSNTPARASSTYVGTSRTLPARPVWPTSSPSWPICATKG